ncbi:MAG: type VI secretion system baseplate subunit TssF [Phycisphaerales bacterium]|nr:MAG: type VI secretion system baseplate subunit TssF [Phycisphaerales bacterium]
MSEDLLQYYNSELNYVRRLGAEFATAHPEVAEQLRLGADSCDDPHVERIIEAFAYLTARIRMKLDDEFPLIAEAMLNVLYPHYLSPIPSMCVAQFILDDGQDSPYRVKRGTRVDTDPIQSVGTACRFRTCYDLTLWPIQTAAVRLGPLEAQFNDFTPPVGTTAMLSVVLRTTKADLTFENLELEMLRFFLHGESRAKTNALYELMINHVLGAAVRPGAADHSVLPIEKVGNENVIRPVGFVQDEAVLPQDGRSFAGYRLMSEYFAFPEKFHFVDVCGIEPHHRQAAGRELELLFFLDRSMPELEQTMSPKTFRLGCTPLVNLFSKRADPIELTETAVSYRVVPDARHSKGVEVYSVDRVTATNRSGNAQEYLPFYSLRHDADGLMSRSTPQQYWYATRQHPQWSQRDDRGTEVDISFVDLEFNPANPAESVVQVEVTCLSRDLPQQLPFGGGQPRLQMPDGGPLHISCLTAPTKTHRPPLRQGTMWRLISHLTLNHLSITGGENGAEAVREILALYDMVDTPETRKKRSSVTRIATRGSVFRAGAQFGGAVIRGLEVSVELDERAFSDHGLFLFASVLESFLGLYCSINSAVQCVVKTRQREEVLKRWPPRAGERRLL